MTLLEILVVLGILGLLVAALGAGIRRVRKSDLREDAGRIAAVLRSAFDRASATGAHHRVVLDLEEEMFKLERCEGRPRLRRAENVKKEDEAGRVEADIAAQIAALKDQAQNRSEATPEAADRAAVAAGVSHSGCAPVKGEMGRGRALRKNRGIGIKRVFVAHLEEPTEEGTTSVNFFPLGYGERAVVEVSDDDGDVYSLVVHPITGRVEQINGEWQHPEEFVGEDAEGKEAFE